MTMTLAVIVKSRQVRDPNVCLHNESRPVGSATFSSYLVRPRVAWIDRMGVTLSAGLLALATSDSGLAFRFLPPVHEFFL